MVTRRRLGIKHNSLLTWRSIDKERLVHRPNVKICSKQISVSFLEWLKHLESPYTFLSRLKAEKKGEKYLRQKSEKQRKEDLVQLEKFWYVTKGRVLLGKLFADKDLTEAGIAKEMSRQGFKMSREFVRQIKVAWQLERDTRFTPVPQEPVKVLDLIKEHPTWSFKNCAEAGIGTEHASHIVQSAGVKKPPAGRVSPEERAARENFLYSAGIEFSGPVPCTPSIKMKAHAIHMLY